MKYFIEFKIGTSGSIIGFHFRIATVMHTYADVNMTIKCSYETI